LDAVGSEPTPAKMESLVESEIQRWKKVIADAGVSPQ
jgi:hypothetical protein